MLSSTGIARRDALRIELCRELGRVHALRQRRRAVAFVAFVTLLLGGILSLAVQSRQVGTGAFTANTPGESTAPLRQPATAVIQLIQTDDSVLDRYLIRTESAPVWMNDRELLEICQEAGRPAGLVHAHGQTRLVPNPGG